MSVLNYVELLELQRGRGGVAWYIVIGYVLFDCSRARIGLDQIDRSFCCLFGSIGEEEPLGVEAMERGG